jgi:hypothetical protein
MIILLITDLKPDIVPDHYLTYTSGLRCLMPAQPAWFHRLESILTDLRELPSPYIDRNAIEKLFQVRERRARQLMAGLPSLQVGNAVAVDRLALISRLEQTSESTRFQWEIARRTRVGSVLDQVRKHSAAARVKLTPAVAVTERVLPALSPQIDLTPGHLHIHFSDAQDLASKLFELSQVMADDWEAFSAAASSPDDDPSES